MTLSKKFSIKSLFFLFFLFLLLSCEKSQPFDPEAHTKEFLSEKIHQFENFDFEPESSLESRILIAPRFVLRYYERLGGGKISSVLPDASVLSNLLFPLSMMSDFVSESVSNHLIAIYFLEGISFSGACERLYDEDGEIYFFIVVNAAMQKSSADEWLTVKQASTFTNDGQTNLTISADLSGSDLPYPLTFVHEIGHLLDFLFGFAWPSKSFWATELHFGRKILPESPYILSVWENFDTVRTNWSDDVFDELNRFSADAIPVERACEFYIALTNSVFPSFYATRAAAEDFAEGLKYSYAKTVMGYDLTVRVFSEDEAVSEFYLWENENWQNRAAVFELFFRTNAQAPPSASGY